MTDREKAIVMAHTGICMLTGDKFRIFHKYVEDIIGRPIWTHDIGFLENEIKEKSKDDFIALCADEDGCVNYKNKCGDLISREETLTAFADYVGSGMSMNDYDALWDIVAKMPAVKQEPKFIAKSDGTIEQIKNCNDCLFKKEWEKIGKLLSNILEKHTEQEPCEDTISRQAVIDGINRYFHDEYYQRTSIQDCRDCLIEDVINKLPSINSQPKTGHWIPVSEKLPDKEGYYLCSVRYMYPPYNFFEPEKVKYMDDVTIQKFDGGFNIEVKAWMPLPEPYKAERSGEE